MSSLSLPRGWEAWPQDKRVELLTALQTRVHELDTGKVPWLCPRADCDGKPHPGRKGPHSRAEQRPPAGDHWDVWLALAGRGWGKTRTGAQWVIEQAKTHERGALVGPTAADTRDILVEGESGILACAPSSFRPVYEPSKRRVTYPNGAVQTLYSADEPDRLRGPQHHYGWLDELASWRRLQHAWDMLQMGMRLGDHPRICITTTPRPLPLIKALVKDERCVTVRGSTYDNLHNLADTFKRAVLDRYEGTTLGQQELYAAILEDLPGALVRRRHIDAGRVDAAPDLDLTVVAVDPAGTGTGDEAGIVVSGLGTADKDVYVLADYSAQMSARETGLKAWAAFYEHEAAFMVFEDNFGKQWLRDGLIDAYADHHRLTEAERRAVKKEETADRVSVPNPYKLLRKINAQHGKYLRAQPVAMRYEQGRVHHVGAHPELEDQLTTWLPYEDTDSPDRIDALVHGATFLMRRVKGASRVANPHAKGLQRATSGSVHPLERMRRR